MLPASGAIQKIVASLSDVPRQVQAEADELATARQQMADLRRALSARPVQMQRAASDDFVKKNRVVDRVEATVFRSVVVGR